MEYMQNLLLDLERSMRCTICLGAFKDPTTTRCDHNFCNECIQNMLKSKGDMVCPLCMKPVRQRSVKKASHLLSIMNAVQDALSKVQHQTALPENPPLRRRLLSRSSSSSSEGPLCNSTKGGECVFVSEHSSRQSITDKVSQWLQNAAPEKKVVGAHMSQQMTAELEEFVNQSDVERHQSDIEITSVCIKRRKVLSPVKIDPQIQESIRNQLWSRDNSIFGKGSVRYTYQARKRLGSRLAENTSGEVKSMNSSLLKPATYHDYDPASFDHNSKLAKISKRSVLTDADAEPANAYKHEFDGQPILGTAPSNMSEEWFSGMTPCSRSGCGRKNFKKRRPRSTSSCPERTGCSAAQETLSLRHKMKAGAVIDDVNQGVGPSTTFSLSQHSHGGLPKHLTDVTVCVERLATSKFALQDSRDAPSRLDEALVLNDKRVKPNDQLYGRSLSVDLRDAALGTMTEKKNSSCHSPLDNGSIPDLICCSSDDENRSDSCHEQESNSAISRRSSCELKLTPGDERISQTETLERGLSDSVLRQVTESFTALLKKVLTYDKAYFLLHYPGCASLMNKFYDVGACLEKSLGNILTHDLPGDTLDIKTQHGHTPGTRTELSQEDSFHDKKRNVDVSSENTHVDDDIDPPEACCTEFIQKDLERKFQDESILNHVKCLDTNKSCAKDRMHETSTVVGNDESDHSVSNKDLPNLNEDVCVSSPGEYTGNINSGLNLKGESDSQKCCATGKDASRSTNATLFNEVAIRDLSTGTIPTDDSQNPAPLQRFPKRVTDHSEMVNRWLASSAIPAGNIRKSEEENGNCSFGLVVTGLQEKEVRFVKAFARKYHGALHGTFEKDQTTHVIVKATNRLTCDRTLKYLQGIAGKKWVVSLSWILESLTCKAKLLEEDFEVLGDNCMKEFDVRGSLIPEGPMRSRTSDQNYQLLAGFFCICLPPFGLISTAQAVHLLEMCGASAVDDLESPLASEIQASGVENTRLIIIDTETMLDRQADFPGLGARFGATVVTIEWIYESISRFEVQPIADFTVTGQREDAPLA